MYFFERVPSRPKRRVINGSDEADADDIATLEKYVGVTAECSYDGTKYETVDVIGVDVAKLQLSIQWRSDRTKSSVEVFQLRNISFPVKFFFLNYSKRNLIFSLRTEHNEMKYNVVAGP